MKQIVNLAMYTDTHQKVVDAANSLADKDGGKAQSLLHDARRIYNDTVLPKRVIVLKWDAKSIADDWNNDGGLAILGFLRYFANSNDDGFAFAKIDLADNTDVVESSGGEFANLFAVEKRIVCPVADELVF